MNDPSRAQMKSYLSQKPAFICPKWMSQRKIAKKCSNWEFLPHNNCMCQKSFLGQILLVSKNIIQNNIIIMILLFLLWKLYSLLVFILKQHAYWVKLWNRKLIVFDSAYFPLGVLTTGKGRPWRCREGCREGVGSHTWRIGSTSHKLIGFGVDEKLYLYACIPS